jgi:hypothetical protein
MTTGVESIFAISEKQAFAILPVILDSVLSIQSARNMTGRFGNSLKPNYKQK